MNNNTKNSKNIIPKELLELVPWYAIGKLSVDDQAFFDEALRKYPLLEDLIAEEQQMMQLVSENESVLDKSAIANQDERLKSVFNMIDIAESQEQIRELTEASSSVFDKLKNLLGLSPNAEGTPQFARAASVAVLVLSVGVLTAFVAPIFTDKSEFVPASASSQVNNQQTIAANSTKTVLLVGFKGTSTELGNIKILKGKLAKIESVPNKEGIYQISFKKMMSSAETKQTIDALLSQKELVWFAGEEFN